MVLLPLLHALIEADQDGRANTRDVDLGQRDSVEGPLLADSVEKVENAASVKFAQKGADRRIRLAIPSQSMCEVR
jgi:hypothetical protein